MKKGINYWSFPGGLEGKKDFAEAVREAKELGYEGIEVCLFGEGPLSLDISDADIAKLGKTLDSAGLQAASVTTGALWDFPLTSSDAAARERVFSLEKEWGLQGLYAELERIDPGYAESIGPNDRSRIIRAMEVYTMTGKPLSAFRLPATLRGEYDLLFLGLHRPRDELVSRIEGRVDEMFARGLAEEVKGLLQRGYRWNHPGMRGIGYREFSRYQRGCLSLENLRILIKRHTRQYAKRQTTFFSALPGIRWFHPDET